MGLPYVDIFYHHRMDSNTPLEETMRALAQEAKALTADCVITSGKVKTVAAHDGDYTTAWRSERVRRPYLEFELPEGETAGYLYVCFTEMPQSWAVEERVDGKWRVVAEGGTDYLHALVELNGQNHFRIVENSGVTTRLNFNEVFVFGAGEAFVRCRQEQQRLEDNFLGEGFRQGKNPIRGEAAADLCEMRRADKDEDTAEIRKK